MITFFLASYTTIIIDEAHERSLHTDILLYLLRMIQKQRRENSDMNPLKLVIMSATMNSEKISAYFDNAPIYYIEGRTYPVEVRLPLIRNALCGDKKITQKWAKVMPKIFLKLILELVRLGGDQVTFKKNFSDFLLKTDFLG